MTLFCESNVVRGAPYSGLLAGGVSIPSIDKTTSLFGARAVELDISCMVSLLLNPVQLPAPYIPSACVNVTTGVSEAEDQPAGRSMVMDPSGGTSHWFLKAKTRVVNVSRTLTTGLKRSKPDSCPAITLTTSRLRGPSIIAAEVSRVTRVAVWLGTAPVGVLTSAKVMLMSDAGISDWVVIVNRSLVLSQTARPVTPGGDTNSICGTAAILQPDVGNSTMMYAPVGIADDVVNVSVHADVAPGPVTRGTQVFDATKHQKTDNRRRLL